MEFGISYQLDLTTPGICPSRDNSLIAMRETPNFRRYPRGRPVCEQRLRTRTGLASRGNFCSFMTAASTCSGVDAGLLMIFFSSSRFPANCFAIFLRFSFFTTLLIFAILNIQDSRFQIPNLECGICNYCLNGIPSAFKSERACSSFRAVVTIEIFIPRVLSTLLKSISGKINCSRIPSV